MIQQADGGTLLLDDVGDLSPDAQARLARFLHRGTLTQLGSTQEVSADVRIISTTNRDLRTLIGEGLFREDLYYRLNVVEIEVPGLAKRPEDIAELARSFLDRLTADNRKEPLELGGDALAVLQAYPWPGNVRQLRNVMEWIVIMAPQDSERVVRPNMLPPDITSEGPAVLSGGGVADLMSLPLRAAREAFERQYLDAQVLRFGGNITRTAKFVGMERSALHRKLRALAQSEDDEADDAASDTSEAL
jgi:two-component system nitrogen regulation response regulator NtrX